MLGCNQAYLHFHSITADKVIGFTEHDFLSQREADYHSLADKALFESADGFIQYVYVQIDAPIGVADKYLRINYLRPQYREPQSIGGD